RTVPYIPLNGGPYLPAVSAPGEWQPTQPTVLKSSRPRSRVIGPSAFTNEAISEGSISSLLISTGPNPPNRPVRSDTWFTLNQTPSLSALPSFARRLYTSSIWSTGF